MLDFNLERLQGQIAAIQGCLTQAAAGDLAPEPLPTGTWIWYPEEDPTGTAETGWCYFFREFELDETPVFAELKYWIDDKGRVYLNGKRLGLARYSRPPLEYRVHPHLKKGKNVIAVSGYNGLGAAGLLLDLHMEFMGRPPERITGDAQWKVARFDETPENWPGVQPAGPEWKPVKLLGQGLVKPWDFIDW